MFNKTIEIAKNPLGCTLLVLSFLVGALGMIAYENNKDYRAGKRANKELLNQLMKTRDDLLISLAMNDELRRKSI